MWDGVAPYLLEELVERPYVVVGFSAWLLLLPLSITSLHSPAAGAWDDIGDHCTGLSMLIALLATLHVLWLSRSDVGEALLYALFLEVCLAGVFVIFWRKRLRLK